MQNKISALVLLSTLFTGCAFEFKPAVYGGMTPASAQVPHTDVFCNSNAAQEHIARSGQPLPGDC